MTEHYSHVRMEAKKAAIATLGTGTSSGRGRNDKGKGSPVKHPKPEVDATP